jgi:hypothetical protein
MYISKHSLLMAMVSTSLFAYHYINYYTIAQEIMKTICHPNRQYNPVSLKLSIFQR